MKLNLSEQDAQKLIDSQRREITALQAKLSQIAGHADRLASIKAQLPESFLRAAVDLAGMTYGETVSEERLEETREYFKAMLAQKPYDREKLRMFSEYFLFALFGPHYEVGNVRYYLREIMTLSGATEKLP